MKVVISLLLLLCCSLTISQSPNSKPSCFTREVEIGEVIPGMKSTGRELIHLNQRMFVACMEECQKRHKCEAINFNRLKDLPCTLNAGGGNLMKDDPGSLYLSIPCRKSSYSAKSCPSGEFKESTPMMGYFIGGADIMRFTEITLEECKLKCLSNAQCKSIDFSEERKLCFLNDNSQLLEQASSFQLITFQCKLPNGLAEDYSHSIIPVKNCLHNKTASFKIKSNKAARSEYLQTFSGKKFEDCLSLCLMSQECNSIDFQTGENKCNLNKVSSGSAQELELAYEFITFHCVNSGDRPVENKCNKGEMVYSVPQYGFKVPGREISNSQSSMLECISNCRIKPNCQSINYNSNSQTCTLNDAAEPIEADVQYVFVELLCQTDDENLMINKACLTERMTQNYPLPDKFLNGKSLRTIAGTTMEDCATICEFTYLCRSIQFRNSDGSCILNSQVEPLEVNPDYNFIYFSCDDPRIPIRLNLNINLNEILLT